jgi:uncharacterized membrane protein
MLDFNECFYSSAIDASLTLFEAFILGILTFIEYRKLDRQNEEMSPRRRQSQPK